MSQNRGRVTKMVRLDLSPHQATVFVQAIGQIQRADGCTRDQAWETCLKLVGRLMMGAETKDGALPIVVRVAEAFAARDVEDLPEASDDDLRLCHFRDPK
ncbi:MAG: hypothetical protein MJD61_21650, partial [Proteobacteria bacterium]|nr:hypothetical protein [Pseudomonadota bacterium]